MESDKIYSMAPFTLWLFMMAFILMSTNITVTAFKRGQGEDDDTSDGDNDSGNGSSGDKTDSAA